MKIKESQTNSASHATAYSIRKDLFQGDRGYKLSVMKLTYGSVRDMYECFGLPHAVYELTCSVAK